MLMKLLCEIFPYCILLIIFTVNEFNIRTSSPRVLTSFFVNYVWLSLGLQDCNCSRAIYYILLNIITMFADITDIQTDTTSLMAFGTTKKNSHFYGVTKYFTKYVKHI